MALFKTVELIAYTQRLELQKEIMPLATVFTPHQKTELDSLYDKILEICHAAIIKEKEVIEPVIL
ncbi:hypothetical protein D0817_24670 [Flavobacterium cupreum]|uniref:Uncharacterized protein n=1 Tax=Flavobacterium cupreum TaxID=2133766 RepID=A0A434A047_9FLAO|nr:hypothetical protein [Flavobacterium cupreum]RUT67760.1 hypothetical protein D0817_24670 [Flavobacterium cupreum]